MRGGGVEGGKEIRGISSDRHIRGDFWLQKLESVKVASWHFFYYCLFMENDNNLFDVQGDDGSYHFDNFLL